MANEGIFAGLQNLPVFNETPDKERDRALLQAGLALLQPQNPLQGGTGSQIAGGIQAGLNSLDTQQASRQVAEQQQFTNELATGLQGLKERETVVQERGVTNTEKLGDSTVDVNAQTIEASKTNEGVSEKNATTNAQNADTQADAVANLNTFREAQLAQDEAELAQTVFEFDENGEGRKATTALAFATARLRDRMPVGTSNADALKKTAASNEFTRFEFRRDELLEKDQKLPVVVRLYPRGKDDPALNNRAWNDIISVKAGLNNPALTVIAQNTKDGGATGRITREIVQPGSAAANTVPGTPEEQAQAEKLRVLPDLQLLQKIQEQDPTLRRLSEIFPNLKLRMQEAVQTFLNQKQAEIQAGQNQLLNSPPG